MKDRGATDEGTFSLRAEVVVVADVRRREHIKIMNTKKALAAGALAILAAATVPVGCGSSGDPVTIDDGGDANEQRDGSLSTDGTADGTNPGDAADAAASDAKDAATTGRDGGAGEDGGPGGNTTQLTCGSATCALPADTCCVYGNSNAGTPGSGPSFIFGCAGGATCPAEPPGYDPANRLKCGSAANCAAGMVCCVTSDGPTNNLISSACAASCAAAQPAFTARLCDPAAAPVGGCACSSNNIDSWTLPNGYGPCGGINNPN